MNLLKGDQDGRESQFIILLNCPQILRKRKIKTFKSNKRKMAKMRKSSLRSQKMSNQRSEASKSKHLLNLESVADLGKTCSTILKRAKMNFLRRREEGSQ